MVGKPTGESLKRKDCPTDLKKKIFVYQYILGLKDRAEKDYRIATLIGKMRVFDMYCLAGY